jgi:hypothetical protein
MVAVGDAEAVSPELQSLATLKGVLGGDAEWSRLANGALSGRVFARTVKGYFVLGPKVLAKGDCICVLWGGQNVLLPVAPGLRQMPARGRVLCVRADEWGGCQPGREE